MITYNDIIERLKEDYKLYNSILGSFKDSDIIQEFECRNLELDRSYILEYCSDDEIYKEYKSRFDASLDEDTINFILDMFAEAPESWQKRKALENFKTIL